MPQRKRTEGDSVDTILAEYRKKLPDYRDFATRCKELVEQLLLSKNVRVHSVTCRPKDVDRLKDKLRRQEKEYHCLTDVTDLAGVRIITHLGDEVDTIGSLIESEFKVLPEHSIDKRQVLDPDRFGYLSLHYVCTLASERASWTEYAPYRDLICEIQVRSILQHAWAEIEHDLGYKTPDAIPTLIRRRFSRLAALLETADDDFMRIRDELTDYATEVRKDIAEKPGEVQLDKVSLEAFIQQDSEVSRIDDEMVASLGAVLTTSIPQDFLERHLHRLRDLEIHSVADLRAALLGNEHLLVGQFERRFRDEDSRQFFKGISVFHLWPTLLAKSGDTAKLVQAYEKMGLDPKLAEAKARELVQAVTQALGGANPGQDGVLP